MGELYYDLVDFIEKSELQGKVTMRFIDVLEDNLDGYDSVVKELEKGLGLPVTTINGKPRFNGELSVRKIWLAIQQINGEITNM
jgi:hypothetical protein